MNSGGGRGEEWQRWTYLCFVDYAKVFVYITHTHTHKKKKLWTILKGMGIPDQLTCLLRNMYAGQEETVRTGHETTDWFQIGKGEPHSCILSPCLFNLYAEYIIWNARLSGAQTRINIVRGNINYFRYADNNTIMTESKEELKSLLMKVKEKNEKAGLKFSIKNLRS